MKSKRLKNPPFYKWGYHFTNKLDDIFQSEELKVKILSPAESEYNEYGNIRPIYFLTNDRLKYLTKPMQAYLNIQYVPYLLKVDVSRYNQYPDFGALADLNFSTSFTKPMYFYFNEKNKKKINVSSKLVKWIKKFNNAISLKECLTNPNFIQDCIATTHSFVILENISISNVKDIWETKNLGLEYFYSKM